MFLLKLSIFKTLLLADPKFGFKTDVPCFSTNIAMSSRLFVTIFSAFIFDIELKVFLELNLFIECSMANNLFPLASNKSTR